MIAGIIIMPLIALLPAFWQLRFIINIVYTIFVVIQFGEYKIFTGIVKGFFASVLSMLTYIILVAVFTLIYMFVKLDL